MIQNVRSSTDLTIDQVRQHLLASDPLEALRTLERSGSKSPEFRSAIGVCQMRLGQVDSAIETFRSLLFPGNGVAMAPDPDPRTVVSFATALLLAGNVAGCVQALDEIGDRGGEAARRLREVITRWRSALPLARRIGISLSGWPSHAVIELPFEPGLV